jgi:hypothetical protein
MNEMNELGHRICAALELPKHRITGIQWNDAIGEYPTITVTVLMWPEDLKKILNPQ